MPSTQIGHRCHIHPPPVISPRMTYDPAKTREHAGNNPNQGMNTRTFMISVIVAVVVLLLVAIAVVRRSSTAATPGKNPSPPSSSPAPVTPAH